MADSHSIVELFPADMDGQRIDGVCRAWVLAADGGRLETVVPPVLSRIRSTDIAGPC